MIDSKAVKTWLLGLQQNIVYMLEMNEESAKFKADEWSKPSGNGITCILEGGQLLERGGVGFSHVTGNQLPPSATAARPHLIGRKWEAMGMSLVFHPLNPYVPTVHLNVRFFVAQATNNEPATWWFGGGMDLTPYYGFDDDAEHFHRTCSDALRPYGEDVYANYKKACDEYFYLKHRNEPRGIGGIFFDDLDTPDFETAFALTRAVGDNFLTAWLPIAQRRRDTAYGPEQRAWQAYRRGRYVEFNLVWDRGTLFGLQSGGRTESILMSMPPNVSWSYDYRPEPNTPEATLYERYLKPKDWI